MIKMAVETERIIGTEARPNERLGLSLVFIATLLWSTTGLFIEVLGRDFGLGAIQISFWRNLLIAVVLSAICFARQGVSGFRLTRRQFWLYLVNGFIGIGIFNICWTASAQINGTPVATTLLYTAPVFVMFGSALFLGEKLTPLKLGLTGLTLLGCALVAGVYDAANFLRNPGGLGLGLATGVTFGLYALIGKVAGWAPSAPTHRGSREFTMLTYVFIFGLLAAFPVGIIAEGGRLFAPDIEFGGWALLFALGLGPTLSGYAFFNAGLKHVPASVASLITTLELPLASLLSLLILGRGLNLFQWAGVALVFGCITILNLQQSNRQIEST
jgi:drug/metabolite transporter, DME family